MLSTSFAEPTASTGSDAKSAIFLRMSRSSPPSERQSSMSGWIPMRRSSLTECCVGFVFSSPAWPMYGTSVRWMYMQRRRPTSTGNWRIASTNGRDSVAPAVPGAAGEKRPAQSAPPLSRVQGDDGGFGPRLDQQSDALLDLVGDV